MAINLLLSCLWKFFSKLFAMHLENDKVQFLSYGYFCQCLESSETGLENKTKSVVWMPQETPNIYLVPKCAPIKR